MQGGKKSTPAESYNPARRSPRLVPAQPVTVAVLEHGLPFAYGVVTNISEGGACVQTGDLTTKRGVQMMLSFSNGEMVQAEGRVVWSKPLEADDSQSQYGIEFTELPEGKRETLRIMLDSSAFTDPGL